MSQQPVYTPPSFPTPLAPPPAPKSSSHVGKLATAAALVAFATMGFVGKAVVRSLRSGGHTATIENANPYQIMSRAYAKSPATFSLGVVKGAERGMKRSVPGGRITFDETSVVTDLGKALRAVADYRGEIPTPDRGTATVEGQTRQYLHANGAILIETTCFTNYSMCVGQEDLIARTDTAVMQHLDEDTVDALLPRGGECEATGVPVGGRTTRVTVCRVEGDMVVTVMRLSLAATREQLRRFVDSPDAKELAKELDGR